GGNTVSRAPMEVRCETAVVAAFFARRLAAANGTAGYGSQYLSRLLEVTDRQQLTRLVAGARSRAQREGAGALSSPGACMADPVFRSAAEVAVRDEEIARLQRDLTAQVAEVDRVRADLVARDGELASVQEELGTRDARISRLREGA